MRNGTLKFHSESRENRSIHCPNNESREIRAILVKSYQSLLPNCTPTFFFTANLAKFAQFVNTQSERREINQFRANLNKSSILIFRLS